MIESTPTNQEIADAIGLTHSGVSRIRNGNRLPSLGIMENIEKAYGWSLEDQAAHRRRGMYDYARAFNERVAEQPADSEAIPA